MDALLIGGAPCRAFALFDADILRGQNFPAIFVADERVEDFDACRFGAVAGKSRAEINLHISLLF